MTAARLARRAAARALLLPLVAVLVACGGLPTPPGVFLPAERGVVGSTGAPLFLPPPVQPGATPTEVLDGFLLAQTGDDADHATARTFLTTRAASTWEDEAGVLVYDEASLEATELPTAGGSQELVLRQSATTTGRVGPDGSWTPQVSRGGEVRAEIRVVREDGEWRLDRVPPGLWLSTTAAARVLVRVSPHFLAPLAPHVTGDPRLVRQADDVASETVRLALGGPSDVLAPAVGTALADLSLRVPVVVEGGTAVVDLVGASDLDGPRRDRAAAQIAWTLFTLPDVAPETVRLLDGGRALPLGADGSTAPLTPRSPVVAASDPAVLGPDPALVAVSGDALVLREGRASAAQELTVARPVRSPALPLPDEQGDGDRSRPLVVGLADAEGPARTTRSGGTAEGGATSPRPGDVLVTRGRGSPALAELLSRPALTPPVPDPVLPRIWTVATAADGSRTVLLVDDRTGATSPVVVRGLAGDVDVERLRPSRDGARVLLVTAEGDVRSVSVGVVERGARDVQVTGLREVLRADVGAGASLVDASWAGADRVVVLGTPPATPASVQRVQPLLVGVDGGTAPRVLGSSLPTGRRSALTAATSDADGADLVVAVDAAGGPELYRGGRASTGTVARVGAGTEPAFPG